MNTVAVVSIIFSIVTLSVVITCVAVVLSERKVKRKAYGKRMRGIPRGMETRRYTKPKSRD